MMRILPLAQPQALRRILRNIRVDPYGIKIMTPKAISHLVFVDALSNIAANILKQEMLSLGGDVAVSKGALTGRTKKTDCLIMGNATQLNRLQEKLNLQPFGLDRLSDELSETLANYQRENFLLEAGNYKLRLGKRTQIMGIVNITADSFSGDGLLASCVGRGASYYVEKIVDFIEQMVKDGADIIDIGGESSRPGAKPVPVKEELRRTIPVIKAAAKKIKVPISIDTYKPVVVRRALDNGAVMVNDITGLRDKRMVRVVAQNKCAVVIMHMKGTPRTMQQNPVYKSLLDEVIAFLNNAIQTAVSEGIDREKIIVDPGIGFGKTYEHNLEILKRLTELKVLGRPIMVGPSRKSFIGRILKVGPEERVFGTVSASVVAAMNGAHIVRVHDVKEVRQATEVLDRVRGVC